MKYKYIPKPILKEGQEAKPLYDLQKDVFIVGWEVGHYEEITTEENLPEDVEPQKEWVKDYEAMELSPEEEAEQSEKNSSEEIKEENLLIDFFDSLSKATTIAQIRTIAKEFLEKG